MLASSGPVAAPATAWAFELSYAPLRPRLGLLRESQAASQLRLDGVRLDVPAILGFGPTRLGAFSAVPLSEVASLT
jgi:hypothetical protein